MEEYVRLELEALERMVLNWKASYLQYATPDGNNDFLVEEFREEITTYMSPYLRRLYQCEYITKKEAQEFMRQCYSHVEDLRRLIQELESPPAQPGFWRKVVGLIKEVRRD
jgi:hypothetical protein|uniref:Uncharacterized protein n=1 Tax=Desulfobacca acetoxidans TaxID=60893 RepID=A0A7C3WIM7_9BACT